MTSKKLDEEIFAAVQEAQLGYERAIEQALGRCLLLGFMPDRLHVDDGFPIGTEEHPARILGKDGAELARVFIRDNKEEQQIQVVRIFAEPVLAKVRAKLAAATGGTVH